MNEFVINTIYPVLYLAGIGFVYFTIKNLLPSYFKEKGKNIATKEDIASITGLVEGVKFEFTRETELLKNQLNIISSIQINILAEERNAIVFCNESFSSWFHYLVDKDLGGIEIDNKNLIDHRQKINFSYQKFLLSESRFSLFIENETLKKSLDDLKTVTKSVLGNIIVELTLALEKTNQEKGALQGISASDYFKEYQNIIRKEKILIEDAATRITNGIDKVLPMHKSFQILCRSYLHELLQ